MPLPKDIKLDNRELYAHNLNLGKSLIKVRASKYAWGLRNGQKVAADRAATTRSIYYLWNQLEQHGGSGHFTSLIQYDHGDYLKVFYDIDRKFPHPPDVPAIKREIIDVVLTPFFRLMWAKLGHHVDTGNVACVEDIRKSGDEYKFSMHIFINNVKCRAENLKHMHSILNYPDWVDVKPYDINTPSSRRLLRMVGASKNGSSSYLKPCSLVGPTLVHPRPLQDYILTYTDGNEADATDAFSDPDARPTSRPRLPAADVALPVRVASRTLVRAAYLGQFTDDQLAHVACKKMDEFNIDSHHPHSKLTGNRMYFECGPSGRKCIKGAHHNHNRAYVEFRRSGEMYFCCLSDKCPRPQSLGCWATSLMHLLNADVWGPSGEVDGRLLDTVYILASDASHGRTLAAKQQNIPDQDWFVRFEDTIAGYMTHFFVFIKEQSMYIQRRLGPDGELLDFKTFSRKELGDHVKPFDWAFKLWESSTYKMESATLDQFCAEPFEADVPAKHFNLCANTMPLLSLPYLKPTISEIETIQPLLDHILHSLVSGDQTDYLSFMKWLAHVVKYPNKKTGWMPFFIGPQGSGKGIILAGLMVKMFEGLGLHATNFDSVTGKFNSDMMFKSLVFIDEGFHSSKKEEADKFKPLITETTYRCEKKFHEPQNLNSYHNYIGASNHMKALIVSADCMRYAIYYTTKMDYGKDHWDLLWDLVHSPQVRELFFQYLRTCVDTGRFDKNAPMTAAKAAQASEQCPAAARWLKSVIMDIPTAAAHVPADVDDFVERAAWENDKAKMTFKSRGRTPPSLINLVGDPLEEALILDDVTSKGMARSPKCVLPLEHVAKCVAKHFQGQSWVRFDSAELKRDSLHMGIKIQRIRLGGASRYLLVFPSIEGCMYLLKKAGWMTTDESAYDEEDAEF